MRDCAVQQPEGVHFVLAEAVRAFGVRERWTSCDDLERGGVLHSGADYLAQYPRRARVSRAHS